MKRNFFLFSGISLAVLFFQSGCSRSLSDHQLQFGIFAAEKDLWEEAIFRWKKVLLENPTSAAAHNNLAVAYEKKGLWEEAEKEYKEALKISPGNKYILANYESFKKYLQSMEKEVEN